MYRRLEVLEVIETGKRLHNRTQERFPNSGLSRVVGELCAVAQETAQRVMWIRRPHLPLRITSIVLAAAIVLLLIGMVRHFDPSDVKNFGDFVQSLEAVLSSIVFIGATIVFLITMETRIKRKRALAAIYELRAIAHIVDMHQLTKDPERLLLSGPATTSSPRPQMTPFTLNRYLTYCSEALALVSKVAALYAQDLQDNVVLEAVDDLEELTTGLSGKIWQKIIVLDQIRSAEARK